MWLALEFSAFVDILAQSELLNLLDLFDELKLLEWLETFDMLEILDRLETLWRHSTGWRLPDTASMLEQGQLACSWLDVNLFF